jgi:hypothetical protein
MNNKQTAAYQNLCGRSSNLSVRGTDYSNVGFPQDYETVRQNAVKDFEDFKLAFARNPELVAKIEQDFFAGLDLLDRGQSEEGKDVFFALWEYMEATRKTLRKKPTKPALPTNGETKPDPPTS